MNRTEETRLNHIAKMLFERLFPGEELEIAVIGHIVVNSKYTMIADMMHIVYDLGYTDRARNEMREEVEE